MSQGPRDLTPPEKRLKGATRLLANQFGSFDAAGAAAGVGRSQIERCCNVNLPDFLRIDQIMRMEAAEGVQPCVTREMAASLGHALVEMPRADAGSAEWIGRIGGLAQEFGELSAKLGQALKDGAITAAEIAQLDLIGEAVQVVSKATAIKLALEQIVDTARTKPGA